MSLYLTCLERSFYIMRTSYKVDQQTRFWCCVRARDGNGTFGKQIFIRAILYCRCEWIGYIRCKQNTWMLRCFILILMLTKYGNLQKLSFPHCTARIFILLLCCLRMRRMKGKPNKEVYIPLKSYPNLVKSDKESSLLVLASHLVVEIIVE